MSMILPFARTWGRWYRVLRYGKGFSFADSVRHGLWLAHTRACELRVPLIEPIAVDFSANSSCLKLGHRDN